MSSQIAGAAAPIEVASKSIQSQPRRAFGWAALLVVSATLATGCVPYVQHKEAVQELDRANEINASLKLALAKYQARIAEEGAQGAITGSRFEALLEKYNRTLADRDALLETYEELKRQMQGMQAGVPLPSGDGFGKEDGGRTGLDRTSVGNLVIEGLSFEPGKHTLKPGPKKELDALAALIQEKYSDRVIHLDGHSDNQPIRNSAKINADNWDLSLKRAHTVFTYLVSKGCSQDNFQLHAYGYTVPADGVVDVDSSEGRARNRRVEVRLGGSSS